MVTNFYINRAFCKNMKKAIAPIIVFAVVSAVFLSGCVDGDDLPCVEAEDCEGLPHIECYGEWTCVEGECAYVCAMMPEDDESGGGGI